MKFLKQFYKFNSAVDNNPTVGFPDKWDPTVHCAYKILQSVGPLSTPIFGYLMCNVCVVVAYMCLIKFVM